MPQHEIHRVVSFSIVGPYLLDVTFEDGIVRRINFLPVLEGQLCGPLKDRALFDAVSIDEEFHTLVWPNGADFDPAILHDWPDHEAAMTALAQRWAAAARGERAG
jgi:hypothetical protein